TAGALRDSWIRSSRSPIFELDGNLLRDPDDAGALSSNARRADGEGCGEGTAVSGPRMSRGVSCRLFRATSIEPPLPIATDVDAVDARRRLLPLRRGGAGLRAPLVPAPGARHGLDRHAP